MKFRSLKKKQNSIIKSKKNTTIAVNIDIEMIDIIKKVTSESNTTIVEVTITKEEDIIIKEEIITKKEVMKEIAQSLIIDNLKIWKKNKETIKKIASMMISIKKDKIEEEEEETTMTEITEIDRGIMKTIIIKILKIKF